MSCEGPRRSAGPHPIGTRAGAIAYLGCAAAMNLPFAVCHPAGPILRWDLARSLVVGLVLFLIPGLPWVGVMIGRGWPARFRALWVVATSLAVLLAVLILFCLVGRPVSSSGVWNAIWIVTNAAILLNILVAGPPACGVRLREPGWRFGGPLFLLGYLLFFLGATRVVPPQEDHDLDVIPGGYALLTRFEPLFVSDYQSIYQFAHPPLFHYWVAGSLLYFDRLEYLKFYDEAAQRVRAAREATPLQRFPPPVDNLAKGTGTHRVVGVDGADYLIDPPLSDGSRRVSAIDFERSVIGAYYEGKPCLVEARTPTVFLAALTVALLGCWIASAGRPSRLGEQGPMWSALLIPAVYATSPEVFVRCGYAGYTAASNFAVLLILIAADRYQTDRRRDVWAASLLASGLAALINHKLILLPAALLIWQLILPRHGRIIKRLAAGVLHPGVLGFLAGTALFWLYGFSVDPAAFWKDHLRTHFLDRLMHHNPLRYEDYPSVPGLWIEFWQHTGYLLLPIAAVTLALGCFPGGGSGGQTAESRLLRSSFRFWAVWTLITAAAFSGVDWRQTKHLMPLLLVFHLAPIRWTASRRNRLAGIAVVFLALLSWNLWTLRALVEDFGGFPITPAW